MKEKIKTLRLIHLALLIGMIVAYTILGELYKLEFLMFPQVDTSSILFLVVPMAAIFMSNMLFKQQLKQADKRTPLEEKMGLYQTASIIRWAILEGAAFLVLFLKPEFIVVGLLVILYFAFLRPSENSIKSDFDAVM